ncbi:hypothetical protein BOTCAL_0117g00150 [Botryotinia calthae]|uniref:Uncharacterized protein n=1 Tax=Botryotinia calthae TaxID=38488 RepID=A0A4Y8D4W8_9HELO|nr:hypothetical protein BOTCAL_0117g00150 [Botryotinia calthae]
MTSIRSSLSADTYLKHEIPSVNPSNARSSLADGPALLTLMHTLSNSVMWVDLHGGVEHGIRRLTIEAQSETDGLFLVYGHRVGDALGA